MNYLQTLIDKAAIVVGGQNKLAEILGFSSGTLSDMKHGRKAVSTVTAIELADITHTSVDEAVASSVLMSVAGTRREAKIKEILGKAQAVGAGGMLGISYKDATTIDLATIKNDSNITKAVIHRI